MGTGSDLWNQFETMLANRDFDGVVVLFAVDALYVEPVGRHEGREVIRAWSHDWVNAFSDWYFKADLVVEQGDVVVAEWQFRGTHTGPLVMADGSQIQGTGKIVEHRGVTVYEVKDGQIAKARDYFDLMVGAIQLGLMPRP